MPTIGTRKLGMPDVASCTWPFQRAAAIERHVASGRFVSVVLSRSYSRAHAESLVQPSPTSAKLALLARSASPLTKRCVATHAESLLDSWYMASLRQPLLRAR